jgi:hypothetical protein
MISFVTGYEKYFKKSANRGGYTAASGDILIRTFRFWNPVANRQN